jgi:solute:Na+ symporter, SSS family
VSKLDWIVFASTLISLVLYGKHQERKARNADGYLRASRQLRWHSVLFGVMATQASAITFLSGPGQAYTDGMRFVQNYFGLPLAMIVISFVFIPVYRKANITTAYEYLETRFSRTTRIAVALLFLVSRAVSTGISIYAPSIILSTLFGWNIYVTNCLVGAALMLYTYSGGAVAIARTQTVQFIVIMCSMAIVAVILWKGLLANMPASTAWDIALEGGKLNTIRTDFSWTDKYNIYTGIIGGFFLSLSYFGTDQSQVGRYISAESSKQSMIALLGNGVVKIPMQLFILGIGVLLFVHYHTTSAPIHFNPAALASMQSTQPRMADSFVIRASRDQQQLHNAARLYTQHRSVENRNTLGEAQQRYQALRKEFARQAGNIDKAYATDANYVFLHYVQTALPSGLVGLLFAVVILASWGSISAAFHALASSSVIDIQVLMTGKTADVEQVQAAKLHTMVWGIGCVVISMFAARMGSLLEAVNELGSLFYGTILGVFLLAFFVRYTKHHSALWAVGVAQVGIFVLYYSNAVSFLWLNVIGAVSVVVLGVIISAFTRATPQ